MNTDFLNMEERKNIPAHVSIIMDGNGRWAQERGLERIRGHYEGVASVRACTEAAAEEGVKVLSLYAFSEENWNRPAEEVDYLMSMMARCMVQELPTFRKNNIRFVVLGNRERLNDELNAMIDDCMEQTASFDSMTLIVFLSYSGRWDILQAARKLARECAGNPSAAAEISYEDICRHLVTAEYPDPDLIIRTSGEQRISNYLLWQCAYSEFYFTPVLWPDFRKEQFRAALEEYSKRDRRYGKVK